MFYVGIIIMLIIINVIVIGMGNVALFVSPGAAIITYGIPLCLIFATYSFNGIKLLFRLFFTLNAEQSALNLGLRVYKDTKLYLVVAGWVGFIIGTVLTLATIDNPEALGPSAATTLLSVFYGYVIAYFFCHPVIRRIERKLR